MTQRKFKTKLSEVPSKREFSDPLKSEKSGISGLLETALRRFKNLGALALVLPAYSLGCIAMGIAAIPAFAVYDFLMRLFPTSPKMLSYFAMGTSVSAGAFTFGFALLLVMPSLNFIFQARLRAWRGPYYSLEAVRWFMHNAFTYLVRYTFLEFVTPSPFNLAFFRMMGMKIGKGTTINSTCISDPSMIEMGDKVTIGGSVSIIAHYGQGGYLVLAPVKIGNGATIGLKATIMGGVTIGENAKVLPHSVVLPKTVIPADETWGGIPAVKMDLSELKRPS